jgi:hypothetical protein
MDRSSYEADGFAWAEQVVPRADLEPLIAAYDELLAEGAARDLGGVTKQVMLPATKHPVFADNPVRSWGLGRARELLGLDGGDVDVLFDMLIDKPPGHPHETPWHQDAAYAQMPWAPAGMTIPLEALQFWVALNDVDEENGCMHFVPGMHTKPLLVHHIASGDPAKENRLLAITDPSSVLDLGSAVAVPLAAGGATVHSYGTPHYTPPNRSADRPRRAYIFTVTPA